MAKRRRGPRITGRTSKAARAQGFGRTNRISKSMMARGGGLHDPS